MIKPKKYDFAKQELRFLRYIISKDRIKVNLKKIAKIVLLPSPTNLKQLQSRLGLFSFYRKYIKGFLEIMRPIYELTRKDNRILVLFKWTKQRQKAFDEIKKKMIMASVVAHPDFDKPFILYIDISGGGIGVVLY